MSDQFDFYVGTWEVHNRRLAKAHLLKEQLAHLWDYIYEGAAWRFLTAWVRALRWQRLPAFLKVAQLLSRHLDGILAYCHIKVPFGKVEAINGNIRAMLRRGPALPRSRVSPAQSPEGHCHAPSPSGRMNTGPATDFGEERLFPCH